MCFTQEVSFTRAVYAGIFSGGGVVPKGRDLCLTPDVWYHLSAVSRMLKADKNFIPCRIDDGDELFRNGIFEFNVTRILEYIAEHPEDIAFVEVDVGDFPPEFSKLNQTHVDSVDPSRPVVLAEIAPGADHLIDGNHRMEKARRLGIDKMWAYKLEACQHVAFLTSKRAYLSYVEYWNGKLKDE